MVDTYLLYQHRDAIREAFDVNWRITLGGFVVSDGFIGGWVTFGTIHSALFSSVLLSELFLADWMMGRCVYEL